MPPEGPAAGTDGAALTYGQRAVGLSFNPSNDTTVQHLKELFAQVIDTITALPVGATQVVGGRAALMEEAVRQAQTAQMWAVKVATWKD